MEAVPGQHVLMTRPDKHKRYRLKMQALGRCPHCGRPCAPFAECAERREAVRLRRNLGVHKISPRDRRRLPRQAAATPAVRTSPSIEAMRSLAVLSDFLKALAPRA